MRIEIKSKLIVHEPTELITQWAKNNLVIDNPDYLQALLLGRYTGNLDRKLYLYNRVGDKLIIPFGCLKALWQLVPQIELWENKIHSFLGNNMVGNINLYQYQETAKNALKKAKNGVLEAPCGSGKTQIGLQLIKEIGGKALWLTHTRELLKQSKERCQKYFTGSFGEITNGKVNIGADITFATVQTMSKIDPELYTNEFDIVIVDECHHCVGTPTKMMQFYKVVSNCNCRYKYGLSATLTRSDNLISTLFYLIGGKVYTIKEEDVGDKIIKAEYKPVEVNIQYDYTEYTDYDGMINFNNLINCLSENKKRNQIIVNMIKS